MIKIRIVPHPSHLDNDDESYNNIPIAAICYGQSPWSSSTGFTIAVIKDKKTISEDSRNQRRAIRPLPSCLRTLTERI
jgi:hypothetical protein